VNTDRTVCYFCIQTTKYIVIQSFKILIPFLIGKKNNKFFSSYYIYYISMFLFICYLGNYLYVCEKYLCYIHECFDIHYTITLKWYKTPKPMPKP